MISSSKIELFGYVGQDPKFPNEGKYPNWITFSVGVSIITGKDQQDKETIWYECKTNTEEMANLIKKIIKKGDAVYIEGYPRAKGFIGKNQKINCSIEVNIKYINVLSSKTNNNNNIEKTIAIEDDERPF